MSQETAEHFQVPAVYQVKSGKGVPEQVRVKPLDPSALFEILENHLYNVDVNAVAAAIEEKRSGDLAGSRVSRSVKIALQAAECKITHRNEPLLTTFSVYQQALLNEIDIGDLKAAKLGTAEPAIEHKQRKAFVAKFELV